MNRLKMPVRRWAQQMNMSMHVALDAVGLMLLSGSAIMWNPIVGTAAAGVSVLILSGRHFGPK
jgi:hypothetical protein